MHLQITYAVLALKVMSYERMLELPLHTRLSPFFTMHSMLHSALKCTQAAGVSREGRRHTLEAGMHAGAMDIWMTCTADSACIGNTRTPAARARLVLAASACTYDMHLPSASHQQNSILALQHDVCFTCIFSMRASSSNVQHIIEIRFRAAGKQHAATATLT